MGCQVKGRAPCRGDARVNWAKTARVKERVQGRGEPSPQGKRMGEGHWSGELGTFEGPEGHRGWSAVERVRLKSIEPHAPDREGPSLFSLKQFFSLSS